MSDAGRIREVYQVMSQLSPDQEPLRQELNLILRKISDRMDEIEGRRVQSGSEGRFCTYPWERNDGYKQD